ncbi:hypothetical protein [Nostoc parmelioides]|uniref:Uncharacterized protein n=1 Tax=Nostoc parmelioides FACHB-3921 TaxID=2692909 RepID=A0ABR8BM01_9NOSO|nr:hypothetical protein [Nostoc parmelioides]MBD2255148.1 hypothetical protein [Nostoc parmelioides FACHB-3921]
MPGNLFIGPRGGSSDYQRSDDPGEEFESNAFVIVGTTAFGYLNQANSYIREYLLSTNNSSSGRAAVESIGRAISKKAPYDLNSSNWLLKQKKYSINVPRDEL